MRRIKHPSQEEVRKYFTYVDGHLVTRPRGDTKYDGQWAGRISEGLDSVTGYLRTRLNGKRYNTHNLIWIYHKGDIPAGLTVDHRDLNKENNLIGNFRLATDSQQNSYKKTSITKRKHKLPKGVSVIFSSNGTASYRAAIKKDKKRIYYGGFKTSEEAEAKYKKEAIKLHGEFALL